MIKASKDVLKKVDGVYGKCQDPAVLCDFGVGKNLSLKEIAFYEQNSSVKSILVNLKVAIDNAPPYEIFIQELLSSEQKAGN